MYVYKDVEDADAIDEDAKLLLNSKTNLYPTDHAIIVHGEFTASELREEAGISTSNGALAMTESPHPKNNSPRYIIPGVFSDASTSQPRSLTI